MKAADTTPLSLQGQRLLGSLARVRPLRALSVLVVTGTLTGCVWSVPEPVLVREPRPEPVPLRIGVYYSPEFQSFTYRHHLTDTAWVLGRPSVRLLQEALALLFSEVVEVPRPGSGPSHRDDLAGIIEPRIVSTGYEYPRAGTRVLPVHVTYGFTLYSPHGKPVASWEVTGTEGKHPFGNPFAAISYLRENFEHAMREAAWKFTGGFRDVPSVREWLAEQGVPKN